MINIDVRASGALGLLERIRTAAKPAIAMAINRTVELGNVAVGKEIQRVMHARNLRFDLPPTQLPKVERATPDRLYGKADIGYEEGDSGSIGARRKKLLSPFQGGDTRTSTSSKYPLAIPTSALRTNPMAVIPQSQYPRNLIGIYDNTGQLQALGRTARIKVRLRKGRGGTAVFRAAVGRFFVIGSPGDQWYGLYERIGKGKAGMKKLWRLGSTGANVRVPNILQYGRIITDTVNNQFVPELDAAFNWTELTR